MRSPDAVWWRWRSCSRAGVLEAVSAPHILAGLQRRIADTRLLLQHRSRGAQAAFAEALQRWPEPHSAPPSSPQGRGFVAEHIDPQMRLVGSASDTLLALSRALEAAARHAQEAEEHLAQARLAAADLLPAHAEAGRLTARARQLAELAGDRSSSAQAACRRIGSALLELGVPPS